MCLTKCILNDCPWVLPEDRPAETGSGLTPPHPQRPLSSLEHDLSSPSRCLWDLPRLLVCQSTVSLSAVPHCEQLSLSTAEHTPHEAQFLLPPPTPLNLELGILEPGTRGDSLEPKTSALRASRQDFVSACREGRRVTGSVLAAAGLPPRHRALRVVSKKSSGLSCLF